MKTCIAIPFLTLLTSIALGSTDPYFRLSSNEYKASFNLSIYDAKSGSRMSQQLEESWENIQFDDQVVRVNLKNETTVKRLAESGVSGPYSLEIQTGSKERVKWIRQALKTPGAFLKLDMGWNREKSENIIAASSTMIWREENFEFVTVGIPGNIYNLTLKQFFHEKERGFFGAVADLYNDIKNFSPGASGFGPVY